MRRKIRHYRRRVVEGVGWYFELGERYPADYTLELHQLDKLVVRLNAKEFVEGLPSRKCEV